MSMVRIISDKIIKIKGIDAIKIIFVCGIFVLPFIFWPKAEIAYELPKVWFFQRWVELLCLAGLFYFRSLKKRKINLTLTVLIAALFIAAMISSLAGVDPVKSIWGNYYRDDGLITLVHLIILFLVVSLYWDNSWKTWFSRAVVIGSWLTGLYSCWLGFRLFILKDLSTPNWYGEIGGFFGNPNFLAGYLLVTLPFAYYWLQTTKHRWLGILGLLTQLGAIGLTFSVMGIVGVGLFVVYSIFGQISKPWLKKIFLLVIFVTVIVGGFFLKDKIFFQESSNQGYIAQSRQRIVVKLLLASLKRPILGWGWANVDNAFESVIYPYPMKNDIYLDKAHSTLLEILVTTGIIGLLIYIYMIVISLKLIFQKLKTEKNEMWWKTVLVTFVIWFLHAQTNVISINEEVIFWVILGVISPTVQTIDRKKD
jgi:O-antigen ligase